MGVFHEYICIVLIGCNGDQHEYNLDMSVIYTEQVSNPDVSGCQQTMGQLVRDI